MMDIQASDEGSVPFAPQVVLPGDPSVQGVDTHGLLATLARRLTWRAVPADGPGSSDAMILLCGLTSLAIWLAFDRVAAGKDARWYPGGLAGLAWYGFGVLALAWLARRAASDIPRLRPVLAGVVAGLPLALLLALAIGRAPSWAHRPGYAVVAIVAAVYLRLTLMRLGATRIPLAVVASAALGLAFATVTSAAWVYPHLWYAPDDEDDEELSWADGEGLLFEQADRIDDAAARMAKGRPGRPDVFFLGFAGVAEQRVFAEELKLSERVVTRRYAAENRSLLLVNDRRDHETWPIASVRGLRRALVRIGERMDAEDVLFLVLTSHGSDDPELSVSNGPLPLEQLDAATLRAALDTAKIRHRVIVISACYSGGFLKPLEDDHTIVLTSAAAHRTSFGCSDARELTYFGEAFLRDALPQADSLRGAFDEARRAIAERETRETITASEPQIQLGSGIERQWEKVEKDAVLTPAKRVGTGGDLDPQP